MCQTRHTWIFLSVAVLCLTFATAIPNLFTEDPAQTDHQASVCKQDGVSNCTYVNINFQALSEENNSILKVPTIGTLFLDYRDDYDGIVHLNYKNDDQTTGYLTYYAMQESLIGTFTLITGEILKLAKCGDACYVFYGVTEKKWTDYNEKGSKNKKTKKEQTDKNKNMKIEINECKAKLNNFKETCIENCYELGLTVNENQIQGDIMMENKMTSLLKMLNGIKTVNEQLKKEGIMKERKIALLENELKTANEILTSEGKTTESKRPSVETQLNKLQADNEKLKPTEMELIQLKREIESKNHENSNLPLIAKGSNFSIDIQNTAEPTFDSSSVIITQNSTITVRGNGKCEIGMFLLGGGGGGHNLGGGGSGFWEVSSIEVVIDGLSTINVEIGEGGSYESGAGHPTMVFIPEHYPVIALGGKPGVNELTSGGSGWSGGGSSKGGKGGSNGRNGEGAMNWNQDYYGGKGSGQNLPSIAAGKVALQPGKGGTSNTDWYGGGGGGVLVDGKTPRFKHVGVGEGYGGGGRKTHKANNGIAILWIKHTD